MITKQVIQLIIIRINHACWHQ